MYRHLLMQVQRLRATEYLRDGAISEQDLTPSGLHELPDDHLSWHALVVDENGEVEGCARYRAFESSVSSLNAFHSALCRDSEWGASLRAAVAAEIASCRESGLPFFEVGGWAIRSDARFTKAAFSVVLAAFALGQTLGGGIGIATATSRNHSSNILRRMGARSLSWQGVELPSYFDPRYNCMMEVVRFDAERPAARFEPMIRELAAQFSDSHVIARELSNPILCAGSKANGDYQIAA